MKTIGINMLAVPPSMAGTGVYTTSLLREYATHGNVTYVVFVNRALKGKLPALGPTVRYKYFTIYNLVHRVLVEQFLLPLYSLQLSLMHSVANTAPLLCLCPVVTTVHDVYQHYYPERFSFLKRIFLKTMVPLSIVKSHKIITVSEATRQDLYTFYSSLLHRKEVAVTYEASQFVVDRSQRPRKSFILFVGTLEPGKNLKTLIKAFLSLSHDLQVKHMLKIVGARGWKNSAIFDLVESGSGAQNIEFCGYVTDEELLRLYQEAHLFVLPSLYEGFGLPVLEAMSQGCPVITSNVSSLPEIAGDAALLIDPLDEVALTSELTQLLGNTPELEEMRKRGYERAGTFLWSRCAAETLLLYNSIIKS